MGWFLLFSHPESIYLTNHRGTEIAEKRENKRRDR